MNAYVIGAGGIGSWLTPALCMLIGKENVSVIDGDRLEIGNLNRQLFDLGQVGQNKAEALAEMYECLAIPEFYSFGIMPHIDTDVLLVCVDNHPARLSALQACDFEGCSAIIAANETHSAEAYVYLPEWKDTNLDPRRFYPEMLRDHTGDPRLRGMGCTGAAQVETPQLVGANMLAAALAIHLFTVWHIERLKLDAETIPHLPHLLRQHMTRSENFKANLQPSTINQGQNEQHQNA